MLSSYYLIQIAAALFTHFLQQPQFFQAAHQLLIPFGREPVSPDQVAAGEGFRKVRWQQLQMPEGISVDDLSGILTYESVLDLTPDEITEAEYIQQS